MTTRTTKSSRGSRRSTKVPHVRRPQLKGAAHVVLRIRRGLPWLRTPKTWRVLERCFRSGKKKDGFRLVEFSVQQGRVGPGRWRPGPPTDPDVRNSRIRLLGLAGSLRAA